MSKKYAQFKGLSMPLLLSLLAVGLSLCSMLVCGAQFRNSADRFLSEHYAEINDKRFSQARDSLSDAFTKLDQFAVLVSSDTELGQAVADFDSPSDAIITLTIQNQIDEITAFLSKSLPDIQSVCISTDINTLSSISTHSSDLNLNSLLEHFGWSKYSKQFYFPGDQTYGPPNNNRFLEFCESNILYAFPIQFDGNHVGMAIFVLSPSFLLDCIKYDNKIALFRDDGPLFYNSTDLTDESILLQDSVEDLSTLYRTNYFPEQNLHLLYQPELPVMDKQLADLTKTYCVIGGSLFIIVIVSSFFFTRFLIQPLNDMRKKLTEIQNNHAISKTRGPFFSRSHIFVYLSAVTLTTTVFFSLFSYYFFRSTAMETLVSSLEVSYNQAEEKTTDTLNDYEFISFYLAYSDVVSDYLSSTSNGSIPQDISQIDVFLQKGMQLFNIPVNLILYDSDGHPLYSTAGQHVTRNTPLAFQPGRKSEYFSVPFWSGNALMITRQLINTHTMQPIGYLTVQIDELYLCQLYDYFPANMCSVYLHTDEGVVVSSTKKSVVGSNLPSAAKNEKYISLVPSNFTLGLTVYYDYSALNNEFNMSVRSLLYLFCVLMCAIVLINSLISRYLASQFRSLATMLSGYRIDENNALPKKSSLIQEINQVYTAFYGMSDRIQALLKEVIVAENHRHAIELEKKQSDLLLLQSQINPHFLYNTFEAINSMISTGHANEAMTMLNALANMLRFSAKNSVLLIPVREELEYIKMYMNIMCHRYSQQLSFSVDFSEEALAQNTAKFILQPILENSIYHGFKPRGGVGHISVTGVIFDEKLMIIVRDDGVGMDPETYGKVTESIQTNEVSRSIGLSNVANRLHLIHGNAASLTIQSSDGCGTLITITQPAS